MPGRQLVPRRRRRSVRPHTKKPNPTLSFSPGNVWRPSGACPPFYLRAPAAAAAPPVLLAFAADVPRAHRSAPRRRRAPTPSGTGQPARAQLSPRDDAMAPTAPAAATGAASPAAPAVARSEGSGKAAARCLGLDLPALPGLGLGLGLAAQGQATRAASCE